VATLYLTMKRGENYSPGENFDTRKTMLLGLNSFFFEKNDFFNMKPNFFWWGGEYSDVRTAFVGKK